MKVVSSAPGAVRFPLLVAVVLAFGAMLPAVAVRAQTPAPLTPGACNGLLATRPGGPAAPTDLTARWAPLPDNPQVSGVLLAWQDNASDETCYVVQVRDSNGETWQDRIYAPANASSADDLVFYMPGDYCFRVFAANDHGASASNEACVQVPEATVHGLPPGAAFPNAPTPPAALTPGVDAPVDAREESQAAATVTPTPISTASTRITPFVTPSVTASPTSAPTKTATSATPTLPAAPATGAGQASSGSAPWWPLALAGGLAAVAGIAALTLRRRAGSGGRSR